MCRSVPYGATGKRPFEQKALVSRRRQSGSARAPNLLRTAAPFKGDPLWENSPVHLAAPVSAMEKATSKSCLALAADHWLREASCFTAVEAGSTIFAGTAFRQVSIVIKNTTLTTKSPSAIVHQYRSCICDILRFVHFFIHFYDATRGHAGQFFRFRCNMHVRNYAQDICNEHTDIQNRSVNIRIQ